MTTSTEENGRSEYISLTPNYLVQEFRATVMHGERTTHDLLKVHALKVASLYVDHSEIQVSYRYPTDTRIVKYHAATFLTVSALTDLPFLKESTNRCARLMRTTGREDYGIFIDLFINRYHA